MQRKTPQNAALSRYFYSIRLLAQCLFARFRPCITQAHGAVKDQLIGRCIAAVEAEVAFTFKLESFLLPPLSATARHTLLNH